MSKRTDNPIAPDQLGNFHFQVSVDDQVLSEETPSAEAPIDQQQPWSVLGPTVDKTRNLAVAEVKPEIVIKGWEKQLAQIRALVALGTEATPGSLPLESVSFSLEFNAKAGVWIFAEVGGKANVEVTFKRKA